jgi:heterotetrameric sarcosine oxidase gamma subunit
MRGGLRTDANGFMEGAAFIVRLLLPRSITCLQLYRDCNESGVSRVSRVLEGCREMTGQRAYSIGPTEWLLMGCGLNELRQKLGATEPQPWFRLTDLSAAYASLEAEGTHVRTVLGSDIGAPWIAMNSLPGDYARTRMAQVEVIVHCTAAHSFELHVDGSLVEHLQGWLKAQYAAHQSDVYP